MARRRGKVDAVERLKLAETLLGTDDLTMCAQRALGTHREIVGPEQRLRQLQPLDSVDFATAPRHGAQRGIPAHGLRSLRGVVASRRVRAISTLRAAFSAITDSLP